MPASSFDPTAFLTVKLSEAEAALESLRAEHDRITADRQHLSERLKELSASIATAESDQQNYRHTLEQLRDPAPEAASVEAPTPRAPKVPETAAPSTTDDAQAPSAETPETAPSTTRILALMSAHPRSIWTVKQLMSELPDVGEKVLSNSIQRLYKRGKIDRVQTGKYRMSRS